MAAKKGGDSKQGLIVVLVFFILSTIGLGVGTYYGFAEQENLNAKIKEEKKNTKSMTEERDWYRFQSWAYRAMVGQLGAIDPDGLRVAKDSFDDGSLGKSVKDREEVSNIFKDLNRVLPWPKGKNVPEATYVKLVADERKRADELEKVNKTLATDKTALQKKADGLEETLAEAKKSSENELIKSNTKATADLSGFVKTIDELRKDVNKRGEEKDALVKRLDEEKNRNAKLIANAEKTIREQRDLIAAREQDLALLKKKSGGDEMPKDWRNDWRVVSIDHRQVQLVYINLGLADKVQPQLTFSIHGVDLSGKPLADSKGRLEVVNVLGEHLSQARITGLKDGNRDPVLVNDILYHPTWSPTLRRHVAVAGIIDLTGDGKDNIQEFLRNLERQNVVVDAFLDLKDTTVKGKGMTVKTEYLILGDGVEAFSERQEKDQKDFVEKFAKVMGEMQDQAAKYGVQVIGLRRYLDLIGYRLPRVLAERQTGSQYRPRVNVNTDTPPEDRAAPAKPAEKKAEDKPPEEKKVEEKKPAEKKPEEKKADDKKNDM